MRRNTHKHNVIAYWGNVRFGLAGKCPFLVIARRSRRLWYQITAAIRSVTKRNESRITKWLFLSRPTF